MCESKQFCEDVEERVRHSSEGGRTEGFIRGGRAAIFVPFLSNFRAAAAKIGDDEVETRQTETANGSRVDSGGREKRDVGRNEGGSKWRMVGSRGGRLWRERRRGGDGDGEEEGVV